MVAGERTVLVVDDERVITDVLCAALGRDGYDCQSASTGMEALARLGERPAAFLLTDVRMPGMSGLELLDQVRLHFPETWVIVLTGVADVPIVVQALRGGACDFLTKPFSLGELRERMSEASRRRREMVEAAERERRREREMEAMAQRMAALAAGVVTSLASVLSAKHPETREHSERVAVLAADLAEALGLPVEAQQALYIAGILHDVGKVAVDSSILEKPGSLDRREFDQVRSHPVESARIVDPIELSPITAAAIRHHHECFDGSGYPDRLAGAAIPLAARILSVADAYDAMTHQRAYRAPLSHAESIARLRSGAGTQWDPEIVEAFVARLEAIPRGA